MLFHIRNIASLVSRLVLFSFHCFSLILYEVATTLVTEIYDHLMWKFVKRKQ